MKKKLISGLFVVLFIGNIGFFTVSEAIENQENDLMNLLKWVEDISTIEQA
ncbi:hypothetical protein [Enterococcus crotali]|uniref:hypothetical protein n=1 Tax=Enterococcus crotali TaxID=1453587 RepID=UPI000AA943B5|nr:hypothetical protein [Enterococcus crotali]